MEDLIKAILKRFKTTPKKTNFRNSGMPLETLVERLGKEVAHPHTLIDTVDVKGAEVFVYDIPTLHKKLIMFVGDAGTTYQGYVPDECYAKIGQPKVDKGAHIHALRVELEQRGLIHDHDDLFNEDEAVVERFMIERGLMKKPRVSTLSANEKKKLHEARNVAKVLGGTNLKGSTAQKKWAEKNPRKRPAANGAGGRRLSRRQGKIPALEILDQQPQHRRERLRDLKFSGRHQKRDGPVSLRPYQTDLSKQENTPRDVPAYAA